MTSAPVSLEPALPAARGPLSAAVIDLLAERPPLRGLVPVEAAVLDSDPCGLDLQLALYVCYELHYRGFAGVDRGGSGIRRCCTCAPGLSRPSCPRSRGRR